jgi:hypothetical protein
MMTRGMLVLLLAMVPTALLGCGGGETGTGEGEDGSTEDGGSKEDENFDPGGGDGPMCAPSEIPELAVWEERMLEWAPVHCDRLDGAPEVGDPALEEYLARVDYDAQRVFLQIAKHTGDSQWASCAQKAESVYRDRFVMPEQGGVVAYWNMSDGLAMDAVDNADTTSAEAVRLLALNGDFCTDDGEDTADPALSRENANCLIALSNAERLGEPRRDKIFDLYHNAMGHIDAWFGSRSAGYYEPFMFAITAEALIRYYEHVDGEQEIQDAIILGLDTIWDEAWQPDQGAFRYSTDEAADENGKDLNLIIAPVFAWAYERTCDERFKVRGDEIFANGARNAYLGDDEGGGAKQFNQNFRWSFEYVRLRNGG